MNTLINKENIKDIVFANEYITVVMQTGEKYSQSLQYYPSLHQANNEDRNNYNISPLGLHWHKLDTDISFESFFYDFSQPFIYHK